MTESRQKKQEPIKHYVKSSIPISWAIKGIEDFPEREKYSEYLESLKFYADKSWTALDIVPCVREYVRCTIDYLKNVPAARKEEILRDMNKRVLLSPLLTGMTAQELMPIINRNLKDFHKSFKKVKDEEIAEMLEGMKPEIQELLRDYHD